jgi:hypothetical protein
MIQKTLKRVYEQVIYGNELDENIDQEIQNTNTEQSDGANNNTVQTRKLIGSLQRIQDIVDKEIQRKVKELLSFLQKYNDRIVDIQYSTLVNFDTALQPGEFLVDFGSGLHYLTRTGAGTRRRMLMATLDWDRQVTMEQISGTYRRTVIRGYDEPDTNLHYSAQRKMYQTIKYLVNAKDSRTQAIIGTHSLPMIDQAPAQNIRQLHLHQHCTTVEQLETNNDEEIEHFLSNLAQQLGLTNSILFYERCFILVEGPTEEYTLPLLYKRFYERTMIEDGIRLLNVNGNGAVKEVLRLFCQNRQNLTIICVDTDTQNNSGSKLTKANLQKAGFPSEFFDERLFLIGQQEFEDTFTDITIANCLQELHPKPDGQGKWEPEEITACRQNKFSSELEKIVSKHCNHPLSKPKLGLKLAGLCSKDEVSSKIINLFNLARQIAGCQEESDTNTTADSLQE